MIYFSQTTNGFYNSQIHDLDTLPEDAVEISDAIYDSLMDAQTTGARIVADANGHPILQPAPTPTLQEQLQAAAEAVRLGLQAAIDTQARTLGFSGGNALILYAGFTNPFQTLAQQFATWEVQVWVEAGEYRDEVIAGNQPMLTPAQAVAMMPPYPAGA